MHCIPGTQGKGREGGEKDGERKGRRQFSQLAASFKGAGCLQAGKEVAAGNEENSDQPFSSALRPIKR